MKNGKRTQGKVTRGGVSASSRAPNSKFKSAKAKGRVPGNVPGSLAKRRIDVSQPYQEQRVDAGIPATAGPNKGVYVQPYNVGQYGKSGFIGQLELNARKKLGNRGF